MIDSYVGAIKAFPYGFTPQGWAPCNGQLLPVGQNQALYSIIGYTFGGSGASFAVPNLMGSIPIHAGQALPLSKYTLGQTGGAAAVTLTPLQLAYHSHDAQCVTVTPNTESPAGAIWTVVGGSNPIPVYTGGNPVPIVMATGACGPTGGGGSHSNMMPGLGLNFCICLSGTYPTQP